jgi:hypothetical protein
LRVSSLVSRHDSFFAPKENDVTTTYTIILHLEVQPTMAESIHHVWRWKAHTIIKMPLLKEQTVNF